MAAFSRIERLLLSLLPTQQRSIARSLWNNLYRDVGQTVSGEVVLVVCGILSLYIGYWALGINGASVLAMIGGLMLLVPVLTIPLALVPAALIAGLQSPLLSLLAVIVGTLTLLAIKRFVAPRVFSAKASINPVLVIVLIMVLAEFAGFWAFLAALPLAAALQAIGNTIRAEQQHSLPEPQRVEVQAIQERIELLAQQIADDQPEAVRMKGLVSRAQKVATELAQLIDPPSGTGSGGRPDRSADLAGRIDAPQPHISRSTRGK